MNTQSNVIGEQLESAFELFNEFSEKLAGSYSDLESHVAHLTQELAESRNERLSELAEKKVLAIKLEGVLDALPAGVVVLDSDERITQTNPVARAMLTIESNDKLLIGSKWSDVARQSIITDGNESRLKSGDLIGRWINISKCSLAMDTSETKTGKIILISDITEIRDLQNKLNRQQRLSSLGEMIAGLAHQIRTPLASALLYISSLNHPSNNLSDRVLFAKRARERLHHLERMVNDMLMFARGDVSESEYINAYDLMTKLNSLIETDKRIENRGLILDDSLKIVNIQANHDAVLSALQNIIDNAIEACSDSKNVESADIKIKALLNKNNQLEISIEDNGCGMTDEVKERIVEPFYTTRSSGTGLGLSVVSATVSRYGGELTIESDIDIGSKFTITFPRSQVLGLLPSNLSTINKFKNNNVRLAYDREKLIKDQEVIL